MRIAAECRVNGPAIEEKLNKDEVEFVLLDVAESLVFVPLEHHGEVYLHRVTTFHNARPPAQNDGGVIAAMTTAG